MTKAKAKSEFHRGTSIPNTLLDELMQHLPTMPTQEDLFGPEGVVKQLSAALIERCRASRSCLHIWVTRRIRGQKRPGPIIAMGTRLKRSKAIPGRCSRIYIEPPR